jgi:cysteine desulfurase
MIMSVYLDNNATTQPLPEVVKGVLDNLTEGFANPSSTHQAGRVARINVERARESVARLIGCRIASDIIFTSCGTESISQVFAIAVAHATKVAMVPCIIHSAVEHAAVLDAASTVMARGARVHSVGVDRQGSLDLAALRSLLMGSPKGTFVFLMLANNETGIIFPIKETASICHEFGAFLHVDAVQAIGKMPVDVVDLDCDYLSLSAHKFHGLKGSGALYIRQGCPRAPLISGHQESGMRGGTENVPGIVAMGVAAQASIEEQVTNSEKMRSLRDRLENSILDTIKGSAVNGVGATRLCNTTNIFFPDKDASVLMEQLSNRGVFVSSGAACSTGGKPSHVLQAMGLGDKRANASLRFSLSKFSSEADIEAAVSAVNQVYSSSLNVCHVK